MRRTKKIPEAVPRGFLNANTRANLANAVYFKAPWEQAFFDSMTKPMPFTTKGGDKTVPTMSQTGNYALGRIAGGRVLEIPYGGEPLGFVVVLPDDKRGLSALEARLTGEALRRAFSALSPARAEVHLPKFTFRTFVDLTPALAKMGMADAFAPGQANFEGIDGTRDLFVSGVVHASYIDVNEKGTEAAAATVMGIGSGAAPADKPVPFFVDRPFAFFVRDRTTGVVLFMGHVTDPS